MASCISGELLVADYGLTIENTSGILENPTAFTFDIIMQQMMKKKTKNTGTKRYLCWQLPVLFLRSLMFLLTGTIIGFHNK